MTLPTDKTQESSSKPNSDMYEGMFASIDTRRVRRPKGVIVQDIKPIDYTPPSGRGRGFRK